MLNPSLDVWVLSLVTHRISSLFLLYSGVFWKLALWVKGECWTSVTEIYLHIIFSFSFWPSYKVSPLKHYVIFCGIYFSLCLMYLHSGLVTFTQPPIYLFSLFHCQQSCLTGLSGEYNLPLSNAFEGFSPFFLHHPPPCHACTWNVTLFL